MEPEIQNESQNRMKRFVTSTNDISISKRWVNGIPRMTIDLYQISGIPTLRLKGVWDSSAVETVREFLQKLVSTGHYNLVVNMTRTLRIGSVEAELAPVLMNISSETKGHYGCVHLIAGYDQLSQSCRTTLKQSTQMAFSEEQALSQILQVPVLAGTMSQAVHIG